MGYINLSVTGFSSSRNKVGVFHHFITFISCLFLRIMFVKEGFDNNISNIVMYFIVISKTFCFLS